MDKVTLFFQHCFVLFLINLVLLNSAYATDSEVFDISNRPGFGTTTISGVQFHYSLPWNYELSENAEREYPFLMFLHGSTDKVATTGWVPKYLGQGNSLTAINFQKQHPSFVIYPALPGDGTRASELTAIITHFKENYRVDKKRIYLGGFSMGGYREHFLAKAYYDNNDEHNVFAATVKIVGPYYPENNNIISKGAYWINYGSADNLGNLPDMYEDLKAIHVANGGIEKEIDTIQVVKHDDPSDVTQVITKTIELNKKEILKESNYIGIGHEYNNVLSNPDVLNWVYRQILDDFDDSHSVCGNGIIEFGETCDGASVDSRSCWSYGYNAGALRCNNDCQGYNTTACLIDPTIPSDTIAFIPPTPSNNEVFSTDSVVIRMATNYSLNHYSFLDWDSSVASRWNMENIDGDGDIADLINSDNKATSFGDTTQIDSGAFGKGIFFDGVEDFLKISDFN